MNILAFETSCDETAVAVVRDGRTILSNVVLSQTETHALYGGVVPEIASRKHMEVLADLAEKAMQDAETTRDDIDAVAVTYAPGLIGALLVGVGFAKSVAYAWQKPLVPVHHILGHLASNYVTHPELTPPYLGLVVSGGHTLLLHVRDYTDVVELGSTCDDAAGEAFDKVARVLGLPYPGGPALSKLAEEGSDTAYVFPKAKTQWPLDLSFSGVKTAVINRLHQCNMKGEKVDRAGMCASFQRVVCEDLLEKTRLAQKQLNCDRVAVAGGVAANARLRAMFSEAFSSESPVALFLPDPALCGDNAAMIASQGFYEFQAGHCGNLSQNAMANCPIDAR